MTDLETGDTIDIDTAKEDYQLEDWGELIDGRYTYAMLGDDNAEYYIAVSEYEVMAVNEYEP